MPSLISQNYYHFGQRKIPIQRTNFSRKNVISQYFQKYSPRPLDIPSKAPIILYPSDLFVVNDEREELENERVNLHFLISIRKFCLQDARKDIFKMQAMATGLESTVTYLAVSQHKLTT